VPLAFRGGAASMFPQMIRVRPSDSNKRCDYSQEFIRMDGSADSATAASTQLAPPPAPVATTVSQTPAVEQVVQVGNTQGEGVFLRRTPNLQDRLAAYPEGTQLRIFGPDENHEGTVWRHVTSPDGAEGYIPAAYTTPLRSPIVARQTVTSVPTTAGFDNAANTRALKAWVAQFDTPPDTPSWFQYIRDVFVSGSTGVAITSLIDANAQRSAVQGVCASVSGWVYSPQGGRAQGVSRVEVRSSNGRVLTVRNDIGDLC
jgi:hypothetical protein